MIRPPIETTRFQLKRLWGTTAPVYGGGAALALLSQLLLTRLLGAEQYGIYYYALSWLTILVVLAKLGVDHAVLRYLPNQLAASDWTQGRGLLRWSSRIVTRASLAVTAGIVVTVLAISSANTEQRMVFLLGSLMVPFWAAGFLRQAAMRSMHHNARALLPELIVAPLFIMGAIIAVKWAGYPTTAIVAMLITVCAFGIALLLGNRWLAAALPQEIRAATPAPVDPAWPASARALFLASGMHLILGNADATLLGLLAGTDEVGIYGIASRCAALVAFPLTIANTFFAPKISELLGGPDRAELKRFLRLGMRMVTGAALLAAIVFWLWGSRILSLFGAGFESGAGFLAILTFAQLVNALCGPVAYVVAFSGQEALVARVLGLSTLASIVACLMLIPMYGALGAALATAGGLIMWNVILYGICCKRLDIPSGLISCPHR